MPMSPMQPGAQPEQMTQEQFLRQLKMTFEKLPNEMSVIWHDHKAIESEALAKSKAVKSIQNDALDNIALENTEMINSGSRHKVEMISVKVRLPSHDSPFLAYPLR